MVEILKIYTPKDKRKHDIYVCVCV